MKSVHVYISGKNVTFPDNFRILTDESNEIRSMYDSIATVGEIRVWWRADFQSGSRVLKKVF